MKLNLGCGENKIPGCINIDIEKSVEPDVVADFRTKLPFNSNTVDSIFLFHTIEHIERNHHVWMLDEFHRVLKTDGTLIVSYPEFLKCVENYKTNYKGKRDFWEATIYGRQLYKSDYHVALMDTTFFTLLLKDCGFVNIIAKPEPIESYNTVVKCKKGKALPGVEDAVRISVWGK